MDRVLVVAVRGVTDRVERDVAAVSELNCA